MTTVEESSKATAKRKPPEWPIERAIKQLGRAPAAAGKFLDRLAKVPVLSPILAFFSSVWVGILFLLLLGVYIGVGSGLPQMRSRLEMTDLAFFDAWPMQVILAGLALTLTIVTLRRIPLTVFKLGVWTVHIGILTLITGCVWYFSQKLEGSVRIFVGKSVSTYFDATERALYTYRLTDDGKVQGDETNMTPLPTLPIFYEHLAEKGNPLNTTLATNDKYQIHITGYYPNADLLRVNWRLPHENERGTGGQAIGIQLDSAGKLSPEAWLVANLPSERLMQRSDLPFGVEYLYAPSPERVRALSSNFTTPIGLFVRIPGKNIERSFSVKPGDIIPIEGSPYTLTVGDISGMPMLSKGYENAFSSALMLHVTRKDATGDFNFDRMAVFRYPERSPDFVGAKRMQDGVDKDIDIQFIDASQPQFWLIEQPDGQKTMISHAADSKVTVEKFDKDNSASMAASGLAGLRMKIAEETPHAVGMFSALIIPPEQRRRGETAMDAMQDSILTFQLEKSDGWKSDELYVPFVQFAQAGEGRGSRQPAVVDVPGVGLVGFLLSTVRRPLPSDLTLLDFQAVKYPSALNSYENFISKIEAKPKNGNPTALLIPQLNDPAADQGLYYFQAGWAGPDAKPEDMFSIIGVGNRPGIWVMLTGAALIVLGIGYSFYVKPVLLRIKKEQLAAWAKNQST